MQTLAEIRRVAKPTATIFISDIAVVDESKLQPEHVSPLRRLVRRFKQDGPTRFVGSVLRFARQKLRQTFGREPVLLPSNRGIWFPHETFVAMCRQNRLEATGFPTEEITGTSTSRYDYIIKPI